MDKEERPKGKVGKPTKYEPERIEKIYKSLRDGNFLSTACREAGISTAVVCEWKQRYPDFAIGCKQAIAQAEAEIVKSWKGASKEDWRAGAELLTRRHKKRWGRVDPQAVNVDVSVKGLGELIGELYEKTKETNGNDGGDEGSGNGNDGAGA